MALKTLGIRNLRQLADYDRDTYYVRLAPTEAYEDLFEAGLLVQKPSAPDKVTQAAPAAAQPKQDERIDRVVRRPRAGLGLRPGVGTTTKTDEVDKPPSVEDFEKLSSDEQEKLLRDARQMSLRSRRR